NGISSQPTTFLYAANLFYGASPGQTVGGNLLTSNALPGGVAHLSGTLPLRFTFNSNGTWSFQAPASVKTEADYSFTYYITTAAGATNVATVDVLVQGPNDQSPIAPSPGTAAA